jgi:hypothetical protein
VKSLVALFALFALLLVPVAAEAAAPAIPINITTGTGSFVGNLNITKFAVQNGEVVALGTLTGTVTQGGVVSSIVRNIVLPLLRNQSSGKCEILHLVLGPLDLNLLGLQIHLNQVVLDISAQPGPGNLLGNLLCTVANLLNGTELGALVNLLNQILGQL